jgi:hypothetical protein
VRNPETFVPKMIPHRILARVDDVGATLLGLEPLLALPAVTPPARVEEIGVFRAEVFELALRPVVFDFETPAANVRQEAIDAAVVELLGEGVDVIARLAERARLESSNVP